MKNQIVLNEQDLHFLVEDAVKNYLVENGLEEINWGGMKNVLRGAFGKDDQGERNFNFNFRQTYNSGTIFSNFNKYAKQAITAINGMIEIANSTQNQQINTYLEQVKNTLNNTVDYFEKVARNVAYGNANYKNNSNPFKLGNNRANKLGYYNMYAKPQSNKKITSTRPANSNAATTNGKPTEVPNSNAATINGKQQTPREYLGIRNG